MKLIKFSPRRDAIFRDLKEKSAGIESFVQLDGRYVLTPSSAS